MSGKHRRGQRSVPWPLFAFGGILLILAAFLFATRGGGTAEGAGSVDTGGTPRIAVEPQKIDYGYVKFGNDETFKIKVTNSGGGALRFSDQPYVEVLEGC